MDDFLSSPLFWMTDQTFDRRRAVCQQTPSLSTNEGSQQETLLGEHADKMFNNLSESKCRVSLVDDGLHGHEMGANGLFGDTDSLHSPPTMIKTEPMHSPPISSSPLPVVPTSLFPDQSNTNLNNYNDAAQFDIYRDLILRHLIQDITTTCAKLSLPTDPYEWTPDQSARWICDMAHQFQLTAIPNQLNLSGRLLCAMSQEEFLARAPAGGDTLHAQLQLWKTAAENYQCNNGGQQMDACMSGGQLQDGAHLSLTDFLSTFNPTAVDMCPSVGSSIASTSASSQSFVTQNYHPQPATFYAQYNGSNSNNTHYGQARSTHSNGQAIATHGIHHVLPSPANSDPSDSGISADSYAEEDLDGCSHFKRRHSIGGAPTGGIHLWQFIRELLDNPAQYGSCVRWLDRKEGIFKIENSHQLARCWGNRKNRSKMNYDKLSRSLRQYYKKNIIKKTGQKQRLIYQFIPPYHFA